jgi:alanine racemase
MNITLERAGAILTIDLGAIVSNYQLLREKIGAAECAGVVKADAYGLGAVEVASALYGAGCRTFFVAHVGEGLELRENLPAGSGIFVLNGMPEGTEDDFLSANLVPVLNSLREIRAWRDHALEKGRRLPAAIQVDSGMSRLGVPPRDVEAVASDPEMLRSFDLRLVLSHLACADEYEHAANEHQRKEFDRLRSMLPAAPASLGNSSGIFLGSEYRYDLARPGAALYGINPTPHKTNPMRQVVHLSARIIQLREVLESVGIGYGHTALTKKPTRLATISLGYADGWRRNAATVAFRNGFRLPFVGRVSMDSIILDVTDCPSDAVHEGDWVDLICDRQTIDQVAAASGTIGYEVLTSLGRRFHRRYIGTAAA